VSTSHAAIVPIDSSWFTIESEPGVAQWNGTNLTLSVPEVGGFTQTNLMPTSLLPQGLIGIRFSIDSEAPIPWISFGFLVYDASGHGQGAVDLINDIYSPTLDNFTRRKCGIDVQTSDCTDTFLGSAYSPFDLVTVPSLLSFANFSLDFRVIPDELAAPAVVRFGRIQWITAIPEPGTLALVTIGFVGLGFSRRRRLH
jgi:hypothetical protein